MSQQALKLRLQAEEQKEQDHPGFDDFDTQIQPEELPNDEDYQDNDDDAVELGLMVDKDGNHYVVDNRDKNNPIIIDKTN